PAGEGVPVGGNRGAELLVEVRGVVDQEAGVYAEEARQEQPGRVGHVAALAGFELGQVREADPLAQLLADQLHGLGLGQAASEAAAEAFQLSEGSELLGNLHGALLRLLMSMMQIAKRVKSLRTA